MACLRLSRLTSFGITVAALAAFLAFALLFPPGWSSAQQDGRRVALVIGNNTYSGMPLQNAVNDARSMRDVLRQLGFTVRIAENTNRAELERTVRDFIVSVNPGDVALFFYSGHGIQVDGENFLVPTDFNAVDEIEAKHRAYSAELIRERMEQSGAGLRIIVLDACRDNPFSARRSGSRGLAAMNASSGTLIAFATGPNQAASDNPRGNNGLFTSYLIEALRVPGLRIGEVFRRVGGQVYRASSGRQEPWTASSVYGDFYFIPPAGGVVSEPSPVIVEPPRPTPTPPAMVRDSIGMRFKLIQSGSFLMGSNSSNADDDESPVHRVTISRPFYIGIHEVTQEQYESVMGTNPSHFRGSNRPVESVSWNDAMEFCRRLSRMEGVTYRLPTEAEWEYACRANITTDYYWGNGSAERYAWHYENSGSQTHNVGQKRPNAWGLHDIAGNVWEWCSDWYDEDYYSRSPARDPQGPSSGERRVMRGGSWVNVPRNLRVSFRSGYSPGYSDNPLNGFRCIRDLDSLNP